MSTIQDVAAGDRASLGRSFLLNFARLRYQLLGGVLFAVILPVIIRWGFEPAAWFVPVQFNTALASAVALAAGLLILRQMRSLPGVRENYYILPALAVTFTIALAVLFFFRLEYNRLQLPISFLLAAAWTSAIHRYVSRLKTMRFAVVPGGSADRLPALRGVQWIPLAAPTAPGAWDGVVADLRADHAPDWERFLSDCAVSGRRVFHAKQLQESLTGRAEIEHLSENTLGSLNPDSTYLKLKVLIDWWFAALVILPLSPLLIAIAIAIRLDSPGAILFVQPRIGFRGKIFKAYKFRTMRDAPLGADARHDAITQADDGRITRLGRFLRRTRLDELPQIINILRGEMSWIGPRPEAVPLSEWYERELAFYRYRHIVRPGISGWAQVNQGHVAALDRVREKLHFDFYYIKNFSLWLDVLIVFRTMRTMITGFGAR